MKISKRLHVILRSVMESSFTGSIVVVCRPQAGKGDILSASRWLCVADVTRYSADPITLASNLLRNLGNSQSN